MRRTPLWIALSCMMFLVLGCLACSSPKTNEPSPDDAQTYAITVVGEKDIVISCPEKAQAGETVFLELMAVTDVDVVVTVNGEDSGTFARGGYEFEMPAEDVEVSITTQNSEMNPGA